jgi:hypothetical protein
MKSFNIIVQKVSEFITKLDIGSKIMWALQAGAKAFAMLMEKVAKFVSDPKAGMENLKNWWKGFYDSAKTWITDAIKYADGVLGEWIAKLGEWIAGAGIGDAFENAFSTLADSKALQALWVTIKIGFMRLWRDVVLGLALALNNASSSIFMVLKGYLKELWDGVKMIMRGIGMYSSLKNYGESREAKALDLEKRENLASSLGGSKDQSMMLYNVMAKLGETLKKNPEVNVVDTFLDYVAGAFSQNGMDFRKSGIEEKVRGTKDIESKLLDAALGRTENIYDPSRIMYNLEKGLVGAILTAPGEFAGAIEESQNKMTESIDKLTEELKGIKASSMVQSEEVKKKYENVIPDMIDKVNKAVEIRTKGATPDMIGEALRQASARSKSAAASIDSSKYVRTGSGGISYHKVTGDEEKISRKNVDSDVQSMIAAASRQVLDQLASSATTAAKVGNIDQAANLVALMDALPEIIKKMKMENVAGVNSGNLSTGEFVRRFREAMVQALKQVENERKGKPSSPATVNTTPASAYN